MKNNPSLIRQLSALAIMACIAALFFLGIQRLTFDANILNSIPQNDPVLLDGRYVFLHHPIHDQIVIDVGISEENPDLLVTVANQLETKMRESGLFKSVGLQALAPLFPQLLVHATTNLPLLFTEKELEEKVAPLLTPENISNTLKQHLHSLENLEGIGQASFISADPLELRNIVLSRLSHLAPSNGAILYKGYLISQDRKHLLVTATPLHSGMNTTFARKLANFMDETSQDIHSAFTEIILTPVGAYRAALDNETSARKNISRTVTFSTIAIALLLIVGFPRPFIGLLALLPAFAGAMTAVFFYSLIHSSISLMAIGFGGAIIAFTVDYGLTYLLFLDRPYATRGMDITREVWCLGLLAMLTTASSFAFLSFSGFPALAEIGLFAALGIVFTYLLVHLVFPLIFPVIQAAKRTSLLPLQSLVNKITGSPSLWKVWIAMVFALAMLFFAKPEFQVNPDTMNSVTPETIAAEQLVQKTWGSIFSKVYLLAEGNDISDLQRKSDQLTKLLEEDQEQGHIEQFFVPSQIFPGEYRSAENLAAWNRFWTAERKKELQEKVSSLSSSLGFAPDAFYSFWQLLEHQDMSFTPFAEKFSPILGLSVSDDRSTWYLVAALTPVSHYDGEIFFQKYSLSSLVRVFDPALFGKHLGEIMSSAFIKMSVIVGAVTLLIAFLVFLDWKLTVIALLPTPFALVCTLGTLNLIGEPLGIPIIMVSVIVIGMGAIYGLYLVRSIQVYFSAEHPYAGLVRLSVFLSFATTFLGIIVLALSDSLLLRNAGRGLVLGLGYSFLGAVLIIPPLMKKILSSPSPLSVEPAVPGSVTHFQRVLRRYRYMESYPRVFTYFKMRIDPMFRKLHLFLASPRVIMDIGTGFGVPAAWILELYPQARLYGIEPDHKRVAIASRVVGQQGSVQQGLAPNLPDLAGKADTALLLDMAHLLSDEELQLTMRRIGERLIPEGRVIIRTTIPQPLVFSWKRCLEEQRIKLTGGMSHFRTRESLQAIITASGFDVIKTEDSAPGHEEVWFIAYPQEAQKPAAGETRAGNGKWG